MLRMALSPVTDVFVGLIPKQLDGLTVLCEVLYSLLYYFCRTNARVKQFCRFCAYWVAKQLHNNNLKKQNNNVNRSASEHWGGCSACPASTPRTLTVTGWWPPESSPRPGRRTTALSMGEPWRGSPTCGRRTWRTPRACLPTRAEEFYVLFVAVPIIFLFSLLLSYC